MIILYLLSLEKPEFTQFAKDLAPETTADSCLAVAWILSRKQTFPHKKEYAKIVDFLTDNCKRNKWDLTEWLIIQREVRNPAYKVGSFLPYKFYFCHVKFFTK